MKDEKIKELIQSILNCETDEFYKKYKAYKEAEEEFNKVYIPFKEGMINLHKDYPELPNTIIVGGAKITYVSPTTKTIIDSKKLKEEEPELVKKYTKTSSVAASVRISNV